jgi:hypothetical protein
VILNIYLKGGAVIRADHMREWERRGRSIQWRQGTDAKVQLSSVDPDEIAAVTRENVKGDD